MRSTTNRRTATGSELMLLAAMAGGISPTLKRIAQEFILENPRPASNIDIHAKELAIQIVNDAMPYYA